VHFEKALEIAPEDYLCQTVFADYLFTEREFELAFRYAKAATASDEHWSRVSNHFLICIYNEHDPEEQLHINTRIGTLVEVIKEALESQIAVPTLFLDPHIQYRPELADLVEALKTKKRDKINSSLNSLQAEK
jgi:hypothetical protein